MQAGQGVVTSAFELRVDTLMLLRLNVSAIDRLFARAPTVISAVVYRWGYPCASLIRQPQLQQPCLPAGTCREGLCSRSDANWKSSGRMLLL